MFIIARVTKSDKEYVEQVAKELNVSVGSVVRQMIKNFMDTFHGGK